MTGSAAMLVLVSLVIIIISSTVASAHSSWPDATYAKAIGNRLGREHKGVHNGILGEVSQVQQHGAAAAVSQARFTSSSSTIVVGHGKEKCDKCKSLVHLLFNEVLSGKNKTFANVTHEVVNVLCMFVYNSNLTEERECEKEGYKLVALLKKLDDGIVDKLDWSDVAICADFFHKCTVPCCESSYSPEQVRLSFASKEMAQPGGSGSMAMRVTWVTLQNASDSQVVFSPVGGQSSAAPFTVMAETRTYTAGGWIGVISSAVMHGLAYSTTYTYSVGSPSLNMSANFTFTTVPQDVGTSRPLRIAVYADMGFTNASNPNVANIEAQIAAGTIDAVLHFGDISYADGDQHHWDMFWRKMQPITSAVPYMTVPGNHELYANFSSYRHRSWMPLAGDGAPEDAMYYSFDLGPASFVMLDTESPLDLPQLDKVQMSWAERQFNRSNAVRSSARPWLLVFQHRPFYCTSGKTFCDDEGLLLRLAGESSFDAAKVDVVTAGHVHNWERTFPLADGIKLGKDYSDPLAPVYVVNGAGGSREGTSHAKGHKDWSAGHVNAFGFGVMEISYTPASLSAALNYTFWAAESNSIADQFTVTKLVL